MKKINIQSGYCRRCNSSHKIIIYRNDTGEIGNFGEKDGVRVRIENINDFCPKLDEADNTLDGLPLPGNFEEIFSEPKRCLGDKWVDEIDQDIYRMREYMVALYRMRNGEPQQKVLKDLDIAPSSFVRFRKYIKTKFFVPPKKQTAKKMVPQASCIMDIPTLSGGERLYAFLTKCRDIAKLPTDCEKTMDDAMRSCLSYREIRIMRMVFWEGMFLEDIGEKLNLTRERVRQIEFKALSKLKKKSTAYIKMGSDAYIQEKAEAYTAEIERERKIMDLLIKKEEDLEKMLLEKKQELKEAKERNRILENRIRSQYYVPDTKMLAEIHSYETYKDCPISELNLSVRAYNGLYNSGIRNVGDIVAKTQRQLLHISNLGKTTVYEITEKLHELGIYLKGEEHAGF